MPQPDQDPNEPAKAGTPLAAPAPAPEEFDLLVFWIQNRKLIIRLVVAAFLAVAVWGTYEFLRYRKRVSSEAALANAKTSDDFRKVTTDWNGTPAGGTAYLRLADELRKAGKPEEAVQALRTFLEKYPLHPLRTAASHELASSLEIAGKLDEALAGYQRLAAPGSRGAFAPLALLGEARVLTAQGKLDDARKALENLEQQYPNSPFFSEANQWLGEIKNPEGIKTGGSPRPTPPPAPAPAPGAAPAPPQPGPSGIPPAAKNPPAPKPASPPAGAPAAPPKTPPPAAPPENTAPPASKPAPPSPEPPAPPPATPPVPPSPGSQPPPK
jgi:tetratricopeptide (TPR) repeat protein